jgi:hypothetical protein
MVKVTQKAADEIQRNENCQRRLKCKSDVTHEMIPRCACRIAGVPHNKLGVVVKKDKEIYSRIRDTIDNHRPDTIAAELLSVAVEECGIHFSKRRDFGRLPRRAEHRAIDGHPDPRGLNYVNNNNNNNY